MKRLLQHTESPMNHTDTQYDKGFEASGPDEKKRRGRRSTRQRLDEERTIDLLRNGDQEALKSIMEKYHGRLYAVANRICKNQADAEEVVQDVFVTALDKIDRFEGRSTLATWLYRIAVNTALMKLRNQRLVHRNSVPMDDADTALAEKESRPVTVGSVRPPEETFLSTELCEQIGRTVDGLPDVYREVFLLRGIHGMSTREAGQLLEVSPGAVKSRLHRSRDLIKERLEPYMKN